MLSLYRGIERKSSLCGFLLLISACDCGGDVLDRLSPKILIEDKSIDFGEVTVGGTKRIYLPIQNVGTEELKISGIDTMAPFFVEKSEVSIAAGATYNLDVGFTPVVEDAVSGILTLSTNVADEPMLKLRLSGQGVVGYLRIEPKKLDFETIPVGAKRELEFVVSNSALEPKTGPLLVEGFERPEHFDLSGLSVFSVTGNYVVGPRSQVPYTLTYQPQLVGNDSGRILFETCGARCGLEVSVVAASGEASVRFEPAQIDFGSVGIDVPSTETLTIFNNGSEALEVFEISVPGAVFSVPDLPALPFSIEPKNRAVVTVQFQPIQAQEYVSEVIVRTSDPTLRQGRVALTGLGEGPLFSVDPGAIDFGVEREIATYRRTFLLSNEGSTPVVVQELQILGDSVFRLSGVPGLPAELNSGETIIGQVVYEPVAEEVSSANLFVRTDDSVSSERMIPVTGRVASAACELDFSPARVNFGVVPVGYGRRKSVQASNVGNASCELLSADFAQPLDPFFSIAQSSLPLTLDPGQSSELKLKYQPTDARTAKVNLIIQTDDAQFPERVVNLVGSSEVSSDIFVLPNELNFGRQRPGCGAVRRSLSVYNAGNSSEVIDRITLSSTTPEYTPPMLNLPLTVPAGQRVSFEVSYRTQDFGEDYADIEIGIVDQPYPFIVPMVGRGDPDPLVTEVFQQSENRKVDVLFVIDDSCSMVQEQMDLAQNFSSFINTANIRSVDFNIGVTTTDIINFDGSLVGPVVRSTTPNYESVFQNQAVRGTRGSGIEMGLEAMYRAIERARSGSPNNRDLLRADAGFVGVIVTDEDDQSPASSVFYLHHLRQNFGTQFQVAGISGGQAGCLPNAGPSPILDTFLGLAGGTKESICSGNWTSALSSLGSLAFGLRDRYALNQAADTNRVIEVRVNGNLLGASDWSYDFMTDEIVFDPMSVPPERSMIEVTYVPRC